MPGGRCLYPSHRQWLALCPLASKGIPWHLAPDALWGLTRGGDLRRAPHLAGAAFGSASELLAECEVVLDKLKLSKRPAQVAALETIARGADLLYVDRTGGGKSLAFQLPAALAWRAAVLAGVALPPILLLVVPYISLGEHQRAAFEAFLARMFAAGQLPRRGHVCFVRRAAHGHQGTTNLSLGTLELITFVLRCVVAVFTPAISFPVHDIAAAMPTRPVRYRTKCDVIIAPRSPVPDGGRAGTGGRDFVYANSSKARE